MAIYKPSLLDKFKDFVNGLKENWEQYERHVSDFESHKAESAGKHITESGSNENGYYVRFDDGTQICMHKVYFPSVAITSAYGSLYRQESNNFWIYPAPFTNVLYGSARGDYKAPMTYINDITNTQMSFRCAHVISSPSTDPTVFLYAVGRWK